MNQLGTKLLAMLLACAAPACVLDNDDDLKTGTARSAERRATSANPGIQALRESFLRNIGGLPQAAGAPPVKKTGQIEGDDYLILSARDVLAVVKK